MEDEYELVCDLSIGAVSNDPEWPIDFKVTTFRTSNNSKNWGPRRNFEKMFSSLLHEKTGMIGLQAGESMMISRLPERDRQTDGQTELLYQYCASARDKRWNVDVCRVRGWVRRSVGDCGTQPLDHRRCYVNQLTTKIRIPSNIAQIGRRQTQLQRLQVGAKTFVRYISCVINQFMLLITGRDTLWLVGRLMPIYRPTYVCPTFDRRYIFVKIMLIGCGQRRENAKIHKKNKARELSI